MFAKAFLIACVLAPQIGAADTLTTLYSFTGTPDGDTPLGKLVMDSSGSLYGVTRNGGSGCTTGEARGECGLVFRLTPVGDGSYMEQAIYNFANDLVGVFPNSGLIGDAAGNLYGTTTAGGGTSQSSDVFQGAVYRLSPSPSGTGAWSATSLHAFYDNPQTFDGYGAPYAPLVWGPGGSLLGTTFPRYAFGTAYILSPPATGSSWTISLPTSPFRRLDQSSLGALVANANGKYFGIDVYLGQAYQVARTEADGESWRASPIAKLPQGRHGDPFPTFLSSLVFGPRGALYGTAADDGKYKKPHGFVFDVEKPATPGGAWTSQVLWDFKGAPDGDTPVAELLLAPNGNFYGTTKFGGTANLGTIFLLRHTPAGGWHEEVIHSFTGADGSNPAGGLIMDGSGALYGTTESGGTSVYGTVFRYVP